MNDQPNTISTSGYNREGRRIFVNIGFAPDAKAFDIAELITTIEQVCQRAGLSVREQGVEPGELTRDIRYLLRREQKNDDGSYSPIIDLYSGNFRWVATWLNNDDQIAVFEAACGVELARMPVSISQIKEYDSGNERVASLFTVLATPAQIVYKDNPKWNENLSDEDKKKISKRLFVRWLSQSNSPPPQPTPLSSENQQAATTLGTGGGDRRMNSEHSRTWGVKSTPAGGTTPAAPKDVQTDAAITTDDVAQWERDFNALMQHHDIERAYPQSNHRAAAINKLHHLNVFLPCVDTNSMAHRVLVYQDYRKAGKTQDEAIAEILATPELEF